jgi:hypothetical protein
MPTFMQYHGSVVRSPSALRSALIVDLMLANLVASHSERRMKKKH